MSTRVAVTCLALFCLGLLAACVSPKDRLDKFGERVIDAARTDVVGMCSDISGHWYLTIDPKPVGAGRFIHFTADVTLHLGETPVIVDVELLALDYMTRETIPGVEPLSFTGVEVDCDTGTFVLPLMETLIPGPANPLFPGTPARITGEVHATIARENHWCGDLTGMSDLSPNSLDGTTLGARRIPPDTTGDALPDSIFECEEEDFEVDAGVEVDASVPDASMPDAMPDAGT